MPIREHLENNKKKQLPEAPDINGFVYFTVSYFVKQLKSFPGEGGASMGTSDC